MPPDRKSTVQTVTPIQLALQHHKAGHLQQAERIYRQILSADSDNAAANHYLGIIAHQVGKNDTAIQYIEKAIAANPNIPEMYCNLGNALRDLSRFDEAVASFQKAISLNPDNAETHNNLGNILRNMGQLIEAITHYRKAISCNPNFAKAHCNLGLALNESDQHDEAIASYEQAVSLKPAFAEAHCNLGIALSKKRRLDKAIASLQKAISLKSDYAHAHSNLGNVFRSLGRLDEAVASYEKAISIQPDFAQAHFHLSTARKHHEYNNAIRAMEKLYARSDISSKHKIYIAFGLGKAFEDLNDYNKSSNYLLEGNRLKRMSFQYSIEGHKESFEKIKEVFSPDFFPSHSHTGNPDETPLFILGMPRSGTTLVEQILSSHSQVFGAGELCDLSYMTNIFCSKRTGKKFPEYLSELDDDEFLALGSSYIERIRKHSEASVSKHITDKAPYNYKMIGLIKTILPKAKVIHCMRDPMDNCYSIFKHNFTGEHKYTYELKELGQYYKLYLDLMDHWRNIIPDFIYDFSYEELVSDQDEQTKKLLTYCGLPWEESCLDFHKTKRKVDTASAVQVRRPMYKDSVQLWKKYENQLEPLRKALYE